MQLCARSFRSGHTVKSVTESFQMSKDAGYKIVAHMMPGAPLASLDLKGRATY
jgi:elongator complex protein 3